MRQMVLRGQMLVKRKLLLTFGFNPNNSAPLIRHEKASNVEYEIIQTYSEPLHIEILDPRINNIRGHFFQSRHVFHIKNVILEPRQGLVYSQDGTLIEESTNWTPNQLYNSFPWNPKKYFKHLILENAIYLPSSTFGHWLMEDLPLTIKAMSLFKESTILVGKNPPKYVLDFLETTDREVIYLDGPVRVNSLILVGKNRDTGWPHPKDIEVLRNYSPFSKARCTNIPTKKIYASRIGSSRSPKNEQEIEETFKENGFQVVHMEKLNLIDEIALLSNTLVIAGIHGSALLNVIWMPKNGIMIDITNDNYWTEAGYKLAHLSSCSYRFITYQGDFKSNVPMGSIKEELGQIANL
jgi:hypothetical protein